MKIKIMKSKFITGDIICFIDGNIGITTGRYMIRGKFVYCEMEPWSNSFTPNRFFREDTLKKIGVF